MQNSFGVPQRSDDDVCPETRAVFADSPSLVLALSQLSCFNQFSFRLATHHIFSRIKHGEVFPDNFLCVVAFQTLGASIPADHVAKRVQAENGVLLHAFDEQTEAFVAFAKGLFCKLALRNILESNTHEVSRQRKDLDTIGPLANELVPIGNLSQVSWLSRVQSIEAPTEERDLQELWEFSQCPAAEAFQCCPGDMSRGGVEVNDSETLDVLRFFEVQDHHSQRQASDDLGIEMKDCFPGLSPGRFRSLGSRTRSSARGHTNPLCTLKGI